MTRVCQHRGQPPGSFIMGQPPWVCFLLAAVAFLKDSVSLTGLKLAQQAMQSSQGAASPRTGDRVCAPSTSFFTFLGLEELKSARRRQGMPGSYRHRRTHVVIGGTS